MLKNLLDPVPTYQPLQAWFASPQLPKTEDHDKLMGELFSEGELEELL